MSPELIAAIVEAAIAAAGPAIKAAVEIAADAQADEAQKLVRLNALHAELRGIASQVAAAP